MTTDIRALLNSLHVSIPASRRDLIRQAYEFADQRHSGAGQKRASGEPYVTHCLEVAEILAKYDMPSRVIIAGLLHDVVEDTYPPPKQEMPPEERAKEQEKGFREIRNRFGADVEKLVRGVTKLSMLPRVSRDENPMVDRNAANLRHLIFAIVDDPMVVMVKLADRLHNMRTLHHLRPEKQVRIATETMEIFAPLANRLGLWRIKSELEDRAFSYLNPLMYHEIEKKLADTQAKREQDVDRIVRLLKQELDIHFARFRPSAHCEVQGRPKHIYSIFRKMVRKNRQFEDIMDTRGVRVVVDDPALRDPSLSERDRIIYEKGMCYQVLAVVEELGQRIEGEYDDYISKPKETFYRSLHTAVAYYDDGRPVEVQIRTVQMHDEAENGIAAHWRYKEEGDVDSQAEQKIEDFRRFLAAAKHENEEDTTDFVDVLKQHLQPDHIFVLTPKGQALALPIGSTPIDFAYHIHTELGHRCRGAKVNGRIAPLNHRLANGDRVEIITIKQGGPPRDWLLKEGYIVSNRARAKIRNYYRHIDHAALVEQGQGLLTKEMRRLGELGRDLAEVAKIAHYHSADDMLHAIGAGKITAQDIMARVLEFERPSLVPSAPTQPKPEELTGDVEVQGVPGLKTKMATCCKPQPGDPIGGYVTRSAGVTVHRQDCSNWLSRCEREPGRIIQVTWVPKHGQTVPVFVVVSAWDRPGLANEITAVAARDFINLRALSSERISKEAEVTTITFYMDVYKLADVPRILSVISEVPNVMDVVWDRNKSENHDQNKRIARRR